MVVNRVDVFGEMNYPPLLGCGCEPQGDELLLISLAGISVDFVGFFVPVNSK